MQTTQLDSTSFVDFYPTYLDQTEIDATIDLLSNKVAWKTVIREYNNKQTPLPRLQHWMADTGVQARLFQKGDPLPWSEPILSLKNKLEKLLSFEFDYVLMNYYRDHKDCIGFHRDDEATEPGKNIVASLSFGATRNFVIVPVHEKKISYNYDLVSGSLLVMRGDTQIGWKHSVRPETELVGPRFNLTFRKS